MNRLKCIVLWMIASISTAKELSCKADEFPCADGSKCFPASSFCNGYVHCRDGSDERLRNKWETYEANSSFCRGKNGYTCVLPGKLFTNKATFCNEDFQCQDHEFPCSDGSGCFKKGWVCDRDLDCRDGSDEVLRDRAITYDPEVLFYPRTDGETCVISAELSSLWKQKCKNITDCQCMEQNHFLTNNCFRCLSDPNFVLPISRLCDGVVDCPDLSDECLCPKKARLKICQKLIFCENIVGCEPHVNCVAPNGSKKISVSARKICDGKKDCSNDEDELGCDRNETKVVREEKGTRDYKCPMENKNATKCDGIPECDWFMDEECDCQKNASYCQHFSRVNSTTAGCGEETMRGYRVCDGAIHCENSSDELGCEVTRFYCGDKPVPNVPLRKRCDRHDDCANGADEKSCSHFYCNDGGAVKYIHPSFTCDGFQDCLSGRDECRCVKSVFSDDATMITSKAILVFVWVMSSVAVIGCTAVVATTVRDLLGRDSREKNNRSSHSTLVKITILSLSVSDFLVAAYTFAICIKAVEFNEGYCKIDLQWRSSKTCSLLGALLVIGSEQSVFVMVLIAFVRLFSVLRPFSQANIRLTVLFLTATWIISIFLGVLPLIPSAEDYFVKSVLFKQNNLFKIMHSDEVQYYTEWLGLIHPNSTIVTKGYSKWKKLESLVAGVNPNITVAYKFGYYSSHTVCLPTLFPDRSRDRAWHYTLLLLIINFTAFVIMLIAYIVLYKYATVDTSLEHLNSLQEKRRKQNTKMQRKLTRIVISDFICWMPICVMGFLQMAGVHIPDDAYIPAGLLIIPVNSALNPVLYSDIPDILVEKFKHLCRLQCSADESETETIEMRITAQASQPVNR